MKGDGAPILLYHAVGAPGCGADARRLDNLSAEMLYRQLEALKRHYRVVTVDQLLAAPARAGLAAVTFDDGHPSVVRHGLPVFEALEIPVTLFVNGHLLEGGACWRDKVRHLRHLGLEEAWERFTDGRFRLPGRSLYFATKEPCFSSREVDRALDAFFAAHPEAAMPSPSAALTLDRLPLHPLLHWGNHGHRHYVLTSLSPEEAIAEVAATEALLDRRPELPRSRVFAVPFGAGRHFDSALLGPLREQGFVAALMARDRWNPPVSATADGALLVERLAAGGRRGGGLLRRLVAGSGR